ncbi:MAG: hypothetical protein ACXAEU_22140 [Candidatus Hodarchaeales archaeon]
MSVTKAGDRIDILSALNGQRFLLERNWVYNSYSLEVAKTTIPICRWRQFWDYAEENVTCCITGKLALFLH